MGKIYQRKFAQEIREPDLAANLSAKLNYLLVIWLHVPQGDDGSLSDVVLSAGVTQACTETLNGYSA